MTPIRCFHCGSKNLRPSHLRFGDVIYFLLLRYPARCRDCRHRFYLNLSSILKVHHYAKSRLAGGSRRQRLRQPFDRAGNAIPRFQTRRPANAASTAKLENLPPEIAAASGSHPRAAPMR